MEWRKIWSVLSGTFQVVLAIGVLVGVSAGIYFMALSRMHRH